ncbi:MAG: hypothetical protein KF708_20445 [Pirellulales bacterium]|nr:hypothetical protein [Pirellulales bacterium]
MASAQAASPIATEAFPAELVEFVPYEKNPIFTGEGPGHWDAKIRERGWILRDGDLWHLWFTGYDGTREGIKLLGHATSSDGLNWKRDAHNPVYSEHWVEDMMVVPRDGTFYMFAEGVGDRAQLLTSPDGVDWTRVGPLDVRYTDGRPLTPGPFGTPTALVEGDTWYLFYERGDQAVWLASSQDLKIWTNVQDEPVLRPGPGAYDDNMIALNQVIKYKGRYYASYHGSGDEAAPRTWNSCLAVSDDLRHWEKYAGNPVLEDNQSSNLLIEAGNGFRLYSMHDAVRVYLPKSE